MDEHEHYDDKPVKTTATIEGKVYTHGRQPASVVVETFTFPAGGAVFRVLGRNLERCLARLQAGTGTVFVGPTNTVSASTGYGVSSLAAFPLELRATDELYAFGDNATLVVLSENYDGK